MSATTNGWDAVCAINAANINQLFRNWYLNNGPVTCQAGPHIQLLVSGNLVSSSWTFSSGHPKSAFRQMGSNSRPLSR